MKKLRILIIGKRGGILQWYENLITAQQQNTEYKIQGFALNHNNIKERFLKKILLNKDIYTSILLRKTLETFKPDLILIADLFYFDSHLLDVLALSPAKKAHWIGDFFDSRLLKSKNVIDLYCFTDSSFIQDATKLGLTNAIYLPLAYNPGIFFDKNEFKSNRLIFIGAWSPDRQELIEQIPVPMSVYGKGWNKLQKAECEIHPYNIKIDQVADLYRQHKYVLNIINKKNIRQGMNMRCFEAPACGCILVSEYIKDLKHAFNLETDIISFSNPVELAQKLQDVNINPELAMYKVQTCHNYNHRLKTLVKILLCS